ncbi:MAG: tRNA threonylcarbamoyladenosine dehydratase [Bacteroidota bacterium]|nr:tRNA threonylcarbamoyladenosine dehydratase [Bacteroidota bacterium]
MNTNWQNRTELLIGKESVLKLNQTHIFIAGLGGVGSWAAEHLIRAGIGEITIVDADIITESNLNRQLLALHSTVGMNKVDVMKRRLTDINPNLIVHAQKEFLSETNREKLLSGTYDYVLDCIDTLTPKINIITFCLEKELPLISSLGSGAKMDPLAVKISDISKSHNCMLGRMLRKRLHKLGIYKGFKVVFSDELPNKEAVILEKGLNKKSNAGTISYLPAIFGSMMAGEVIQNILKRKF